MAPFPSTGNVVLSAQYNNGDNDRLVILFSGNVTVLGTAAEDWVLQPEGRPADSQVLAAPDTLVPIWSGGNVRVNDTWEFVGDPAALEFEDGEGLAPPYDGPALQ